MPEKNVDEAIGEVARPLVAELLAAGRMLATAESCTGGWIAKAVTDIPGSSGCFACGIVSYSNDIKASVLGVAETVLSEKGAVSKETVREMAAGVLRLSGADDAVAVSGIAGPDGGTPGKPIGTVWIAWARTRNGCVDIDAVIHKLSGDRAAIRGQSVVLALQGVRDRLPSAGPDGR